MTLDVVIGLDTVRLLIGLHRSFVWERFWKRRRTFRFGVWEPAVQIGEEHDLSRGFGRDRGGDLEIVEVLEISGHKFSGVAVPSYMVEGTKGGDFMVSRRSSWCDCKSASGHSVMLP